MIVGVDIGTQSLKAVVVGDDLVVRGAGTAAYEVHHPQPGRAEQDPRDWERALGAAIAGALSDAGVAATDIRAMGLAGQLDGCVAVDEDGGARAPCLIWMDRRAALGPAIDADAIRTRTGVVADPGHMAAKIGWLRAHGHAVAAAFHQPVSYLVERLTGARVMDRGLASTTMLYDPAADRWDPPLLAMFDIDAGVLPRLADATAVAGVLSSEGVALAGLPAGIPVAVGTGDDFATPLGAGVVAPGVVACGVGTAEVVGALHPAFVVDPEALVQTHVYPGGAFFVENPGWLAGGAIAWLRGLIFEPGRGDFAAIDALAGQAPAGADDLLFLPALTGAMAPRWEPDARGAFYGLTPAHGRAHLCRAVMEGCALAMRDVIDRLRALGVATERIVLLGGGTRSAVWAQLRADVAGLPVEVCPRADTCAVGAAMLAAVASGAASDLGEAAGRVVAGEQTPRQLLAPVPESAAVYQRAHRRHRELFAALTPLFGG